MVDRIAMYAHVAEITDRIAIELLKAHEFKRQMEMSSNDADVAMWYTKMVAATETARFQEDVLHERLADMDDGELFANVLIGAIHISTGAGIVSQFENLKRQEHAKGEQKNPLNIAAWDGVSRDACELRAQGKSALNKALKDYWEAYDYPVEGRTF